MKKTKIICSIGPSSQSYDMLSRMASNGMNVARINFSHGHPEQWKLMIDNIQKLNETLNIDIALLFDTKGPDFRIEDIEGGFVKLEEGKLIKLTKTKRLGNIKELSVNYPKAIDKIPVGATILMEDGLLKIRVITKDEDSLTCEIMVGGKLASKKSMNVPGINLGMPFISKADISDIEWACDNGGDFLALSFVNTKEDIYAVRELLEKNDRKDMQIIAKIESQASVENIDEIIKASDGIMIARGDLGVEMPMAKLPVLQKDIINRCRRARKICIVATEMMASMYTSSRPSRAEVSDVANAVFDGTDAVMLSGETTIGKYPDLATKHMAEACESAEAYYDYNKNDCIMPHKSIPITIAKSVVNAANMLDAKLIVAATKSGYTASLISNLKPKPMILATCVSHPVARSLALQYGVFPQVVGLFSDFEDVIITAKVNAISVMGAKDNDIIIITGGMPIVNQEKTTNFMKIEKI